MNTLTNIQEQILDGHLLGDGFLIKRPDCQNSSFWVERNINDKEYLIWTASYFESMLSDKGIYIRSRKDKENQVIAVRTRILPVFNDYYNKWYIKNSENKNIKIVPRDLVLTPLMIAIWLADDGHIKVSRRYKNSYPSFQIILATNGFDKEEAIFLQELLIERYGPCIYLNHQKNDQYIINVSDIGTIKRMLRDIDPFFPPMPRKSNIWRDPDFDLNNDIWNYILSIPKTSECIYCGNNNSYKNSIRNTKQIYFCRDCHKIYMALSDYSSYGQLPKDALYFLKNKIGL